MPPKSQAAKKATVRVRAARPTDSRSTQASAGATDLASLAGQIPAEILQQLTAAIRTGHWMFAVWHVSAGKIQLERTATQFPTADLDRAVKLLSMNLKDLISESGA